MDRRSNSIAIILVVVISILCWVSIRLMQPPPVVPTAEGDGKFSAERALEFLKVIAKEPHPAGTLAHDKVRDYILQHCKDMGLETTLLDETALRVYPTSVTGGRTQNILAKLKGSAEGRSILVMAHYDSQPNTYGASDDGMGVAAMMEAIRFLKSDTRRNTILFLFTDQEESGLLGAESFVSLYDSLSEISLIINMEARGNAGVSQIFEFSNQNGWMIRELSVAVERPFASSIAYEVYKLMPNDTDFTMFRSTDISGFNSAIVDGYAYYHSMADRPGNMDVRSLQHHGSILLQSLLHFGTRSLEVTKDRDMIFFNPVGSTLLLYPLGWDQPLIIATFVVWLALVVIGVAMRRVKISSLFVGMGLFIAFIILSLLAVWGVTKLILLGYPHYTNFYSYNFYNATDYLWTVAGITLFCFVLLFNFKSGRPSLISIMLGCVFVLLLIMVAIKMQLNTGAYLIYYPTIILLFIYLCLFTFSITRTESPVIYGIAQLFFLVPSLLFWIPVAYTLHVIFSLQMPFGAVVLLIFCAPALLPTMGFIHSWHKRGVWIFPALLTTAGLVLGHIHSLYDEHQPLQSELMYAVDTDTKQSYWISTQEKLDPWLRHYFPGSPSKGSFDEFHPGGGDVFWRSDALTKEFTKGTTEVLTDSVINGKRLITLKVLPDSTSRGVRLYFPPEVRLLGLNDRRIEAPLQPTRFLQFYAPPPEGFIITIEVPRQRPLSLRVIEQRPGLPSELLIIPLPPGYIHAPDYLANSTQVKYEVEL